VPQYYAYISTLIFKGTGHAFKFDPWVVQEGSMARGGEAIVAAALQEKGWHTVTKAPD
jgi:hypothetical protein